MPKIHRRRLELTEVVMLLTAILIDLTFEINRGYSAFLIGAQMVSIIYFGMNLRKLFDDWALDRDKAFLSTLFNMQNLITGFQLFIVYIAIFKVVIWTMGAGDFFNTPIQMKVVYFFIFASFVLMPVLKWVNTNGTYKQKTLALPIVGAVLIGVFILKDVLSGVPFHLLPDQYQIITSQISGVNYAIIILLCQYADRKKQKYASDLNSNKNTKA